MSKYCSSKHLLEQVEDALALTVPVPCGIVAGEAGEGFCDAGVVVYEPPVEVSKPQKGLYFLDVSGLLLVDNGLNFAGVHPDIIQRNNDTKVLNFHGME